MLLKMSVYYNFHCQRKSVKTFASFSKSSFTIKWENFSPKRAGICFSEISILWGTLERRKMKVSCCAIGVCWNSCKISFVCAGWSARKGWQSSNQDELNFTNSWSSSAVYRDAQTSFFSLEMQISDNFIFTQAIWYLGRLFLVSSAKFYTLAVFSKDNQVYLAYSYFPILTFCRMLSVLYRFS